jgi:long-chain fatty acid transport protein
MRTISKKIKLTTLLLGATVLITQQVQASEGYFQYAWGARHSALAGAGMADVRDATGQIINPAGIVGLEGSSFNLGLTIFSPKRKYTGGGAPSFTQNGEVKSGKNYFYIPTIAYTSPIDETSSWGLAMYGNGGMNTTYPAAARPLPDCPPTGGAGIFCGGPSGVDLMQGFVAATYAKSFGKISLGISPLFAFQMFEAKGLAAFGGFSSDPANLTDNGHNTTFGFGIKLSVQADVSDKMRIAVSYQPKVSMGKFDKYAGLFEGAGSFDIPANFSIGVAFDITDAVAFMADYKHISYSKVGAVGNPTTVQLPFGADGGPGFGWDNVNAYKAGVEWAQSDNLTLRVGVSTNSNPIGPEDVTLNILAPGVVKTRYTAGFEYRTSDTSSFEFAAGYVPNVKVTGPEQFNPAHTVDIEMHQTVITFAWKKSF